MDSNKQKPAPFVVSIEVGRKKPAPNKKKTPAKKKADLMKGQLTLTQMPCITPSFARAAVLPAEEDSDVASLSVFVEPVSPPGKNKMHKTEVTEMEVEDIKDLTVIYSQKSAGEEVGDLVEMQNHVLDHYLQLGHIKQDHGTLVEVY